MALCYREVMGDYYREYNPEQVLLLPPCLRDWLPANHLAHFISDTVETLHLSRFYEKYEETGNGTLPYEPRMMVKALVYGYCVGVFSSRKIEKHMVEDVAFRMLGAGNFPSYRTIARFREENLDAFCDLFRQVVRIAQEAKLTTLGRVAVDGTKIKANASRHKAMSYGRMNEEEARLKKLIKSLVAEARAVDAAEDAAGEGGRETLPGELADPKKRLKVIQEAKRRIEERERAEGEKSDDKDKKPDSKSQGNFTDPDSRIMRNNSKGFDQCYNAQAAVDAEAQIIIAAEVSQNAADSKSLLPMVDKVRDVTGEKPKEVLADAGYRSEENLRGLEKRKITGYVALGREGKNLPDVEPKKYPATARMKDRLKKKSGWLTYAARKGIVEPVFGWVKNVVGFRSFSMRGHFKVAGEWKLICLAVNLRRMAVFQGC